MRCKIMIGLIAMAAMAAMGALAISSEVLARGGHGAHGGFRGGGHFGGFRGGFVYPSVRVYGYGYSCWRYWGGRRVWVCGGYPFY